MSNDVRNAGRNAVTNGVRLSSRPDQTRVVVLTQVCGLSVVKVNHHHQPVTREPSPQSDDDLRYETQTNNGRAA